MELARLQSALKFVLQYAIAGLAMAFIVIYFFPDLAQKNQGNSTVRPAGMGPVSYHQAVMLTAPAVVNVYASKILKRQVHPFFQDPLFRRFFGDPPPETQRNSNLGSGVIINDKGYLLTNVHVINQADEILITLNDGRQAKASIVGIDAETDLAVLHIDMDMLPAAPLGDSNQLAVGDVVLAIGNPYDFGQTVTQGIVSATGRKRLGITTFEDFIQTDADINPGNSGGALINARGELVGINTAIFSRSGGSQGIGFAIPVGLAVSVMQQIIDNGYVLRGWLGIEAQIVPQDIEAAAGLDKGGVLVAGVLKDGPAAEAGIIPGDILIKINDEKLYNPQQAIQLIAQHRPGTNIDIILLRGWEEMKINAQVAQRPSFIQ